MDLEGCELSRVAVHPSVSNRIAFGMIDGAIAMGNFDNSEVGMETLDDPLFEVRMFMFSFLFFRGFFCKV
ncbi:unnamed protein product [Gongylonema pulchrum]|uniref:Uncharacterized protein n=1 Tax=Gongylonema pulchrum TaxID=637853 RepID=A0A183EG17_9BILA|nr:unnamed protein product [Gongylonema pulchrum]